MAAAVLAGSGAGLDADARVASSRGLARCVPNRALPGARVSTRCRDRARLRSDPSGDAGRGVVRQLAAVDALNSLSG